MGRSLNDAGLQSRLEQAERSVNPVKETLRRVGIVVLSFRTPCQDRFEPMHLRGHDDWFHDLDGTSTLKGCIGSHQLRSRYFRGSSA